MNDQNTETRLKNALSARYCLIFLLVLLAVVWWLHLGTLLVTILFSYFILKKLAFLKNRWLTVTVFSVLVLVICFGLVYFIAQAFHTLPRVAATSVPIIIQQAKAHGIELPFTDWDSLKNFTLESITEQLRFVGTFANTATKNVIFFIIGLVVAISIFFDSVSKANSKKTKSSDDSSAARDDLYSSTTGEIARQFQAFYESFHVVMGAQMIISAINTMLTAIFVIYFGVPYAPMVIAITFLCGLLPIVGNLISNFIIVGIALTVSLQMAFFALIFLVILHKLEYFLNSKIIGDRIKNSVWLTLLGLVIGERLLGITGMILAPVVLHFIKMGTSQVRREENF
ncbi:MAG: AI-2E family transporter [bacterium]